MCEALLSPLEVARSSATFDNVAVKEAPVAAAQHVMALINVVPGDWGDARVEDITAVLRSATFELLRHVPGPFAPAIMVEQTQQGYPETRPYRSPSGEFIIALAVQGRHWAQFSYQYSHELCHLVSNHARQLPHEERWFDEALCETASLFVLRQMAQTWQDSPPYPNWREYAPSLRSYADDAMSQPHRQLAPEISLADWYQQHRGCLRKKPYWREGTQLAANQLLATFESDPSAWHALRYLNQGGAEPRESFEAHLAAWRTASPARLRLVVVRIGDLFGIAEKQITC